MGSHGPHDLDCADVVEAVYLYLDGELSTQVIDEIRQHLDECGPCLREYGIEREVKALIARSCTETAPDALRASVVARLDVPKSTRLWTRLLIGCSMREGGTATHALTRWFRRLSPVGGSALRARRVRRHRSRHHGRPRFRRRTARRSGEPTR